jgi:Tfp pilus assembly PilM family ATPase
VRSLLPADVAGVTGVLLVDIGATTTNIVYFNAGAMRFTTSIQRGGDDLTMQLSKELSLRPTVAAEQKALVGADSIGSPTAAAMADLTRDLVQAIATAVQDPIVRLGKASGIRAILLSGGTANLPGIVSIFNEAFPSVPVQVGNPLINLAAPGQEKDMPLSLADATHFTTAIGLALRPRTY